MNAHLLNQSTGHSTARILLVRSSTGQFCYFSRRQDKIFFETGHVRDFTPEGVRSSHFCSIANKVRLQIRLLELIDSGYLITLVNNEHVDTPSQAAQNFFDAVHLLTKPIGHYFDLSNLTLRSGEVAPVW